MFEYKTKVKEITLQPIKRFDLGCSYNFFRYINDSFWFRSKCSFKKNFGPFLGPINLKDIKSFDQKKV